MSAKEQAVDLAEVSTAIALMDQSTPKKAAVEQKTAAGYALADHAVALKRLVGQLRSPQTASGIVSWRIVGRWPARYGRARRDRVVSRRRVWETGSA